MRPAVEAEKLGIPGVVITTTGFTKIARAVAKAEGMSDVRIAEYPGAVGVHAEALVEKNVEDVLFGRIVDELTRPVKAAAAGAAEAVRNGSEIVFEGTSEAVNEFFTKQEWTDNLPVIPPTVEKVAAFLKHTNRDPDETIAILAQANLRATPRNIAANAVMAGCKPETMPLLIAAVEAIADNEYNLSNIGSTWGVLPFLLIGGPAIKSMGIDSGAHMMSQGANPAVGRAFG